MIKSKFPIENIKIIKSKRDANDRLTFFLMTSKIGGNVHDAHYRISTSPETANAKMPEFCKDTDEKHIYRY